MVSPSRWYLRYTQTGEWWIWWANHPFLSMVVRAICLLAFVKRQNHPMFCFMAYNDQDLLGCDIYTEGASLQKTVVSFIYAPDTSHSELGWTNQYSAVILYFILSFISLFRFFLLSSWECRNIFNKLSENNAGILLFLSPCCVISLLWEIFPALQFHVVLMLQERNGFDEFSTVVHWSLCCTHH